MICFFDFEFTGLHQTTTPVSLGMVSGDGKTFYAEFTDYDARQVTPWLRDNVLAHLRPEWDAPYQADCYLQGDRATVALEVARFLAQWQHVQMWGDVPAYDWMLFCQLFGGALHIPQNVYYVPFDIATLFWVKTDDPDWDRQQYAGLDDSPWPKHHALWDAYVIRKCYDKLTKLD